jgi:hypothetical protein
MSVTRFWILDFGFWIGSALKGRSLKSDIFLIIPFKKGGLKPLFLVKVPLIKGDLGGSPGEKTRPSPVGGHKPQYLDMAKEKLIEPRAGSVDSSRLPFFNPKNL